MQSFTIKIFIVIVSFASMKAVNWFTHKFVMNGLLWVLHKDHHKKESSDFFEHTDFFFLIFALPGIAGLYFGMHRDFYLLFWAGLGITLYGFAYFFVYDIFIHHRFKIFRNTGNSYFIAIRRAHKMHHKHIDKYKGDCLEMLWVPFKYFSNRNPNSIL